MKILWVSRHAPLSAQLEELRRLFGGDVTVVVDSKPFDSAEDIAHRIRRGGYDDAVVVAPLSVVARLVDLGIRPLYAEMEAIPPPDVPDPAREVEASGRWYRFRRFRRIVGITIHFEDL